MKPQSPGLRPAESNWAPLPTPVLYAHGIMEDTWFCLLRCTCHTHLSTHPQREHLNTCHSQDNLSN